MIDTHCHIDQYRNPLEIAQECEREGIITIGMTYLPSHYEMGYPYLANFKKVRLALGMHPLYAKHHNREWEIFLRNLNKTCYIGEVGLDYSPDGIDTKKEQVNSFCKILRRINTDRKILSIHSRKAEEDVFQNLIENKIKVAIFHWYTGSISVLEKIVNNNYYISVNPAMIKSRAGQEIINAVPLENILAESDGPFIRIGNREVKPADIRQVYKFIASQKGCDYSVVEKAIHDNFFKLINWVKA